ncbi:MAG TPA: endonuclease/exonuclease/phosphatase family protein [Patescibacteria group bacterium]|nr:endonuclease/exonuclease/phosphatase family protein [Patescibacteria group bacterium]
MKLISLNVAYFEPNNPKLISFLQSESPDLACFQEVTRDLIGEVDKKYVSKNSIDKGTPNLNYCFFGPTKVLGEVRLKDFHEKENFYFNAGGYLEMGNYTKCRDKILEAHNIFLEGNFSYLSNQNSWPGEQERAILVTDILTDDKKLLRVINYHGIWTRDKQGNTKTLEACKKIVDYSTDFKGNVIICGDFNLYPDTPSMKVFQNKFVNLIDRFKIKATRPLSNELSGNIRNVVDYIFVDSKIKVKDFNVIDNDVSDHLPLVLNFEL